MKKLGKVEEVKKLWLSAKEAKAYLDCSDEFLRKLRNNGSVIFSLCEGKYYYKLQSIEKMLERSRVI